MQYYTDDIAQAVLQLIGAGVPVKSACVSCGIDRGTYYEWRRRGESGEEPYATFLSLADTALEASKVPLIKIITDAGKDDWRAAAWLLKCRDPENFGDKQKTEVENSGAVKVNVVFEEAKVAAEE